jgi:hypothetical protein
VKAVKVHRDGRACTRQVFPEYSSQPEVAYIEFPMPLEGNGPFSRMPPPDSCTVYKVVYDFLMIPHPHGYRAQCPLFQGSRLWHLHWSRNSDMDFIFGNTTVPTWTIVIIALFTIPTAVPRSLFTTVRSQYVGGQLQILDSSVHDLELYVFENRDHLPVLLRTHDLEPELEK